MGICGPRGSVLKSHLIILVKFISLYFWKHNTRVVSVTHETDGLSRFLGFAKSVCLCICLYVWLRDVPASSAKVRPRTGHEGQRVSELYLCSFCLTSALDGGGQSEVTPWERHGAFLRGRLGGHQGHFGRVREISPSPGFDPRTFHTVTSSYTDWAIPAQHRRVDTSWNVMAHGDAR